MQVETYKKLVWALIGGVIGMILFVPTFWLGEVLLAGLIGFGVCYGIAAWRLHRPEPDSDPIAPPPPVKGRGVQIDN